MKAAYAAVTAWVRLHASCCQFELRLCNEFVVAPLVAPLLAPGGVREGVSLEATTWIEELTAAQWFLDRERRALLGRVAELFGPRELMPVRELLGPRFDSAAENAASALALCLTSIHARRALLEDGGRLVDAHTRLLLSAHQVTLTHFVIPPLTAVLGELGDGRTLDVSPLQELYASHRPSAPRPHPDSYRELSRF